MSFSQILGQIFGKVFGQIFGKVFGQVFGARKYSVNDLYSSTGTEKRLFAICYSKSKKLHILFWILGGIRIRNWAKSARGSLS